MKKHMLDWDTMLFLLMFLFSVMFAMLSMGDVNP
jgi:hypothetical protein